MINISACSDLTREEAELLLGKTVEAVDGGEHTLTIKFTDGTVLEVSGARWEGCSLGVNVTK